MKTTKIILILVSILFSITLFIACKDNPNKQIDEGVVENGIYHSNEIGWTMEVPRGWKVIHRNDLKERQSKGDKIITESTNKKYKGNPDAKLLINFQKDQLNFFQSTSEPIKNVQEWRRNNRNIKKILCQTYLNQGIKIDTFSTNEKISKLEFEVFHVIMYNKEGQQSYQQDFYSTFTNGFDFAVNINANSVKEKLDMELAWKNSKFE